tara:strand:+ start:376 stop:579 length:204 start_codon:yes stop_codon:yes gene_type:complete
MFYYNFYFEEDEWLFDFSPIYILANQIILHTIKNSGMETNDFLLWRIEEESNKLVDSTAWIPIELRQ